MSDDNPLSQKCSAHSKRTGKQCGQWAIPGGRVCKWHGGGAPQVIAKAEERIEMHYLKAVRVAGELLDRPEFPTVQAQMVRFIVEHRDGKPSERVAVEMSGDAALIAALLAGRKRAADARKAPPNDTSVQAGD